MCCINTSGYYISPTREDQLYLSENSVRVSVVIIATDKPEGRVVDEMMGLTLEPCEIWNPCN